MRWILTVVAMVLITGPAASQENGTAADQQESGPPATGYSPVASWAMAFLFFGLPGAVSWDAWRRDRNPWIWGPLTFFVPFFGPITWFAIQHNKPLPTSRTWWGSRRSDDGLRRASSTPNEPPSATSNEPTPDESSAQDDFAFRDTSSTHEANEPEHDQEEDEAGSSESVDRDEVARWSELADQYVQEFEGELSALIGFDDSVDAAIHKFLLFAVEVKSEAIALDDKIDHIHALQEEFREAFTGGPQPHQVLGIDRDAGFESAREAYRKLVKRFHPDKLAQNPEAVTELANQKTREVTDAWEAWKESKSEAST